MSSGQPPAGPSGRGPAAIPSRRGFLQAASTAGLAAVVAVPLGEPGPFPAAERTMVLQVARAGAVFPIEFPSFGEPGSASSRATSARLRGAAHRCSRARLALARSGAGMLIADGLLDQPRGRLLDGLGELARNPGAQRGLTAAVALAIATVSRHFDAGSDVAAQRWLGGLRELRDRGGRARRDIRWS